MHTPPTARRRAASFPIVFALALLLLALVGPASAFARDGGGGGGGGGGGDNRARVTVAGSCGRGATSYLTLRERDGVIQAEFEVHGRTGLWRVAFVQEQHVAYRGRARTSRTTHSFSLERRLGDYPGPDQVFARAVGPRGITCSATATLPG